MEELVLRTSIDTGDSGKSLNSLRAEFKSLQKELNGLDTSSKDYIKTLQKLGNVKDEISDLNTTIKALNPEGKINALTTSIGGVASGFQAATAASALFGGESEQLNRQLLKVQSAMAFTDGIKGLVGLGDGFKVLRVVILSNPLFLIVGLVAAIGIALFEMKDKIAIVGKAFDFLTGSIKSIISGLTTFLEYIGLTNTAGDAMVKKAEDNARKQIEANKRVAKIAKEMLEDQKKDREKEAEDYKAHLEKIKKIEEENTKKNDDAVKVVEEKAKEKHKINLEIFNEETSEFDKERTSSFEAIMLKENEKHDADLRRKEENKKQNQETFEKETKDHDERIEAELAKEKALQAQKYALAAGTLNSIQSVSDAIFAIRSSKAKKGSAEELKIAKQQFNVNKALQIAQITMQGVQGVQAALSSGLATPIIGPAVGAAFAAIAGITAAANIAKVASTKFDGGGASGGDVGGGGAVSIPSISATSAPTVNAPSNSTTQLNQDGTVKQPNRAETPIVKAIVVETDITSTQKNVGKIQQNATIS